MRFTISREKLQEGLAAVAASIPTKTTLAGAREHPGRGDRKGHSSFRHRSRYRRDHRSRGRRRDAGRHHDSGQEAQRDRARAAAGSGSHRRCGRAARHARLRPIALQDSRTSARRVSRLSECPLQRKLAHPIGRSSEAHLAHVVRGLHRGEPADSQRRPLGAQAGHDADGGHQRPPPREDGNADQVRRRSAERSDRPAESARADSPSCFPRTRSSRSPRAKTTSASARRSPRCLPV